MIKIDGSFEEGGGQILRTALALSIITQKPFDIYNIRINRPQPGLKPQHLYCIKAMQQITDSKAEEVFLGSKKIRFIPQPIKKSKIDIDLKTAGSITLFLQSILLPCIMSNKKIIINVKGGTDVKWSMLWDYYNEIIISHLKRYATIDSKIIKRGFYPKGQGDVLIKIKNNNSNKKLNLFEKGKLIHIKGISSAPKNRINDHFSERQANSAKHVLSQFNCPIKIDSRYHEDENNSFISLWATYSKDENEIDLNNPIKIGSDFLGKDNLPEEIGSIAANKLVNEINSGAVCDEHLADNLIPFLAIYGGKIKTSKITKHILSNIYVCETFLNSKIEIEGNYITAQPIQSHSGSQVNHN